MTLHRWNKAADALPWHEWVSARPALCGLWVREQFLTRWDENTTCADCCAVLCANAESAPHSAAPHSFPPFLHNLPNSQNPPKGLTQMVEMSKGGVTPTGSNPAGVAPPTTENQTGHSTAPEQSAVPVHTEGPEKRRPEVGDPIDVVDPDTRMWHRTKVDRRLPGVSCFEAIGPHGRQAFPDFTEGGLWRRPRPDEGGGSVLACADCGAPAACIGKYDAMTEEAPACNVCCGHGNEDGHCRPLDEGGGSVEHRWVPFAGGQICYRCNNEFVDIAPESAKERIRARPCVAEVASADESAPLPPVHRCPERVSAEGEAIENCDAVIGRDVQCFVCLGARCYVHCGCLQHHKGAKVVHRGGQGSFEWAVWEFEHAFRGQLYAKAADGSGLVILGTHGGASSDAVLSILLRSLERIQGRKVRDTRGEVIGQSAKARPTNEAAGELRADNDPEFELHELDAKVVLMLDQAKRQYDRASELMQKVRLGVLGACTDWLRATEHVWQDFAEDPEQNPRLVWQAKELHDQQVADLFFRLGALFNGGAE